MVRLLILMILLFALVGCQLPNEIETGSVTVISHHRYLKRPFVLTSLWPTTSPIHYHRYPPHPNVRQQWQWFSRQRSR